jgi:enterochelin esterase-like enzyme
MSVKAFGFLLLIAMLVQWLMLPLITAGCAAPRQMRLKYGRLKSSALGKEKGFGVYVPPAWDGEQKLPLVVFLHGGGDDEKCLDRYGAAATLDRWILSGKLPPFLMVVPDGDRGFWRNWYDKSHRYQDYVIEEILPRVRSLYPVLTGRESTHLMGISMGGAGTMYMALDRPDIFTSAAVISAPLFNTDQVLEFLGKFFWRTFAGVQRVFGPPDRERQNAENIYTRIRSPEDLKGLTLFIGAGAQDEEGLLETNRAFHEHLKKYGVSHRYLIFEGGHRWKDWNRIFPVALCKHLDRGAPCTLPPDPFYVLEEFTPAAD